MLSSVVDIALESFVCSSFLSLEDMYALPYVLVPMQSNGEQENGSALVLVALGSPRKLRRRGNRERRKVWHEQIGPLSCLRGLSCQGLFQDSRDLVGSSASKNGRAEAGPA